MCMKIRQKKKLLKLLESIEDFRRHREQIRSIRSNFYNQLSKY